MGTAKRKTTAKAKASPAKKAKPAPAAADKAADAPAAVTGLTVVIEHCKSWGVFKTRANKIDKLLKEAVPGVTVSINPDKPRKGCFEVRAAAGTKFLSLLDMPRPFKPLRDLDIEGTAQEIAEALLKAGDKAEAEAKAVAEDEAGDAKEEQGEEAKEDEDKKGE